MRKLHIVKIITTTFLVACLSSSLFVSSGDTTQRVDEEDFQEYFYEFFKIYEQQLENTFASNSNQYSENLNYTVYVTVSNNKGAAVEFFPSNRSEIIFKTTNDEIENAVFPNLAFNVSSPDFDTTIFRWEGSAGVAMFNIGNSTNAGLSGMVIITNQGDFINLGSKGELYLFDTTVDGKYFHAIIIRGSNTKDYWTKEMAEKDAKQFFEEKTYYGYEGVKRIKDVMAYPVFVEMVFPILWKQRNATEIGYSLVDFENDMDTIRKIASDTYHFQPTYVDSVYEWLDKVTPKPLDIDFPETPWYSVAPWDWGFSAIVGGLLTIFGSKLKSVIQQRRKKTRKSKKK